MWTLNSRISRIVHQYRSNVLINFAINKKRFLVTSFVFVTFVVFILSSFTGTSDVLHTDEEVDGPVIAVPGPASFCSSASSSGERQRISFMETTGTGCLTPRQSCAVESAARANPDMDVYVYFNTKKSMDYDFIDRDKPGKYVSCDLTDNLRQYQNIKFIHDDLNDYLSETKIGKHFDSSRLKERNWSFDLFKNMLGLLELFESGGIFLDFDVLVFRPLHCLLNAVSFNEHGLEFAALTFTKKHPFLSFAINYFSDKLDAGGRLGAPETLAEAFKKFCKTESLSRGEFSCESDSKVSLLGTDTLIPLRKKRFQELTSDMSKSSLDFNKLARGYLIITDASEWNKKIPTTSFYASLARNYCPSTMYDVGKLKVKHGL